MLADSLQPIPGATRPRVGNTCEPNIIINKSITTLTARDADARTRRPQYWLKDCKHLILPN